MHSCTHILSRTLHYLYCRKQLKAVHALAHRAFHFTPPERSAEVEYDYLIPRTADRKLLLATPDGLLSCALAHLISVDVLGVSDNLADLEPQLRYHAANETRVPHILRRDMTGSNHRSPSRPTQMIRKALYTSVRRARSIDVQLYHVAKLVAAARSAQARRCLDRGRSDWHARCGIHAMCTINVSASLATLIAKGAPLGCPGQGHGSAPKGCV